MIGHAATETYDRPHHLPRRPVPFTERNSEVRSQRRLGCGRQETLTASGDDPWVGGTRHGGITRFVWRASRCGWAGNTVLRGRRDRLGARTRGKGQRQVTIAVTPSLGRPGIMPLAANTESSWPSFASPLSSWLGPAARPRWSLPENEFYPELRCGHRVEAQQQVGLGSSKRRQVRSGPAVDRIANSATGCHPA